MATKKTVKKKQAKSEQATRGKLAAMKKPSKKRRLVRDSLPRNSR